MRKLAYATALVVYYCTVLIEYNTAFTGVALDRNFVFSALSDTEKQVIIDAMELLEVKEDEDLIVQGTHKKHDQLFPSSN